MIVPYILVQCLEITRKTVCCNMEGGNNDLINATDINKFVYCHLAWYFTKNIGNEKLREMAKERNAQYKTAKGNDPRDTGTAYHKEHSKKHVKVSGGGCLVPIVCVLLIVIFTWVVLI